MTILDYMGAAVAVFVWAYIVGTAALGIFQNAFARRVAKRNALLAAEKEMDRQRRIREGRERNAIVQRERAAQKRMERQNAHV